MIVVGCANCGLPVEPDGDGWGHVGAAQPRDSRAFRDFWERGCADPAPRKDGRGAGGFGSLPELLRAIIYTEADEHVATEFIVQWFRNLPVEQRMEAMGMERVEILRDTSGRYFYGVEYDDKTTDNPGPEHAWVPARKGWEIIPSADPSARD